MSSYSEICLRASDTTFHHMSLVRILITVSINKGPSSVQQYELYEKVSSNSSEEQWWNIYILLPWQCRHDQLFWLLSSCQGSHLRTLPMIKMACDVQVFTETTQNHCFPHICSSGLVPSSFCQTRFVRLDEWMWRAAFIVMLVSPSSDSLCGSGIFIVRAVMHVQPFKLDRGRELNQQ